MYILKNTYFCEKYKDMRVLLFILSVTLLLSCSKTIETVTPRPSFPSFTPSFEYQGYNVGVWCYDCGDTLKYPINRILDSLQYSGSNTVIIDFGVNIDDDGKVMSGGYEPNMNDIKNIIKISKRRGLKVVLKPHTITSNSTNNRMIYSTPDTAKYNKNIINEWKNKLINIIQVLGPSTFDVLCFGTEMDMIDTKRREDWIVLIDAIRKEYNGKLTYDAVFNRWKSNPDIEEVVFWDKLDFIGLSLYVSVSKDDNATESEIQKGWESDYDYKNNRLGDIGNVVTYLKNISSTYNKKIYVMEGGYQSSDGSLNQVVSSPSNSKKVNNDLQSRGLSVYLKNQKDNTNFFIGTSIWGIHTMSFNQMSNNEIWYTQEFPTFGKPSNLIVKKYFGVN